MFLFAEARIASHSSRVLNIVTGPKRNPAEFSGSAKFQHHQQIGSRMNDLSKSVSIGYDTTMLFVTCPVSLYLPGAGNKECRMPLVR